MFSRDNLQKSSLKLKSAAISFSITRSAALSHLIYEFLLAQSIFQQQCWFDRVFNVRRWDGHRDGELLKTGIYGSGSSVYPLGTGQWATSHSQTSPPHKYRFAFPSNGIIYNPSKLKLGRGPLPPPHFPWAPSKQAHACAAGMRADVLVYRIPARANAAERQLRTAH